MSNPANEASPEPMREVVERSSLGTPEAQAARSGIPDEAARAVVERSKALSKHDELETLLGKHGVDQVDTQTADGWTIAKATCRTCGDIGTTTPSAHLADVLIGEK